MNTTKMFTLFKRELMDIFRDKKTFVMMILVPLLLYPLLIIGMVVLMNAMVQSEEEKTYYVAFDEGNEEVEDELTHIFDTEKEEIGYTVRAVSSTDPAADLLNEEIDAYVSYDAVTESYKLNYLSAKDKSNTAAFALKNACDIYRERLREENITEAGFDVETLMNPIKYESVDQSTREESVGSAFGSLLPFFIITSILLGAIYPAIDVTAGERERGTLETLLTLPVTNVEMITSKFLAVSVISSISAFLNVLSMGGAVIILVSSSLELVQDMDISINYASFLPGILFTLVVMMVFSMFVTALCMCTCIFAKSFKEANNYVTPVMLVVMILSYVTMVPDMELTQTTAVIPVVNVALMVETLFKFEYDFALFAIVLFTNIAYSALTVLILGRLYNSEQVLFGEGFNGLHLFDKRSEMKEKQMPGVGDVVLVLCVVLLLMMYLGNFMMVKFGVSSGTAVQQGVILIVPLVYAWYMKADMKKLFMIKAPKPMHVLGGVLLAVGCYIASLLLGSILIKVFPGSAKNLTLFEDQLTGMPTAVLLVVAALMPAIGEEILFRGFLMGTLKEKYKAWITIFVTAVIFAVYHMSIIRFFTVGILGFAMCYAAYRSGSIFVSMLLHLCINSFSVLLTKEPDLMKNISPFLFSEGMEGKVILVLVAIMLTTLALGFFLLRPEKTKE